MASIVDYMKKAGQDPSFDNRKMLFSQFFPGQEFSGTAEQNQLLMGKMQDPNSPVNPGAQIDQDETNANAQNAGAIEVGGGQSADEARAAHEGLNMPGDPLFRKDQPLGSKITWTQEDIDAQIDSKVSITTNPSVGARYDNDESTVPTPNDYGAAAGGGASGINSQTSNAVDFNAQKAVDDSKAELEKIKPPQTLLGIAGQGMNWAAPHLMKGAGMGLGAAKGLLGDVSLKDNRSLKTAGGWGDLGMDALKGVGGLAAGAGGLMSGGLGMAFKGLGPLSQALGNVGHDMGSAMMGMQMPRY